MKKNKFTIKAAVTCILAFGVAIVINSCSDDPVVTLPPPATPEVPSIESVMPLTGRYGDHVTIEGAHFINSLPGNAVKINGKQCPVLEATETQLVVEVPLGAGSGKITVTNDGGTVEGPEFTYILTFEVSTFAGTGAEGFLDGAGSVAQFTQPSGLAFDSEDNLLVADRGNQRIRKISPDGFVTTIAGNGEIASEDGIGLSAKVSRPTGIFVDQEGIIYFAEGGAAKIRMISLAAEVTTIAGSGFTGYVEGLALDAQFSFPTGVVKDSKDNLFVADFSNNVIRKISSGGVVSTFAGDGTSNFSDGIGTAAQFMSPWGITIDSDDNLFVSDFFNHRIRKITSDAVVTTLAGGEEGNVDGLGEEARFAQPAGLKLDGDNNLYVSDGLNATVRKLDSDGKITTIAGNGVSGPTLDGLGKDAQFSRPFGLAINSKGEIFVADNGNHVIRKIIIK